MTTWLATHSAMTRRPRESSWATRCSSERRQISFVTQALVSGPNVGVRRRELANARRMVETHRRFGLRGEQQLAPIW